MQLTNCPVCEGKISISALACPHCGHPVNSNSQTKKSEQGKAFLRAARLIFFVGGIILSLNGININVDPPEI
jgi:predicted amidophosphoribosyltransferase